MSKKKNLHKSKIVKPQKKRLLYILILVCLLIVVISYIPVINAEFVNWDDNDYVLENPNIVSWNKFYHIITQPVHGNYHPLTMLSLAFNYSISGKNASSYHVINIILHMLNVVLVFFFVMKLTGNKHWIAFITAILFGIHPLHVESVAWVSERKDLLYSFFFLAGMIAYLHYLDKQTIFKIGVVFIFFLFSLLSKPAAVIFPIVLLVIDYYYGRLKKINTYFEKIPFLIFSFGMGLLTIYAQKEQGAIGDANDFPFHIRLLFGSYGIMMYILKTVFPLNLCAFYPFPAISQPLPLIYYFSLIFNSALLTYFIYALKKHTLIAFSLLFYLVNLLLVLQFFPVGSAVIADRYSYLPLLGIFLILGYYIQQWINSNANRIPVFAIVIVIISIVILFITTFNQAATWKNSAALWDKAILVSPSGRAYTNRGLIYKREGNFIKAMECYNKAIELNSKETDAFTNRGNIHFFNKQYDLALLDYNSALSINPQEITSLENRAATYSAIGNYEPALADISFAIKIEPNSKSAFATRASIFMSMKKYSESIDDFYRHLKINNDLDGSIWNTIGIAYMNMHEYEKSINSFTNAININPNGHFFYNRSYCYYQLQNKKQALTDVEKAIQSGITVDPAYLKSLK